MPKDFGSAGSAKTFAIVNKASAEKANVITVKMVADSNLVDYPNNHEDISNTSDLENSIREIGFTDPIEVTGFEQPDGKYMIVSGHRRRVAGVKRGIDLFPCIVKSFSDSDAVYNYVLLANSYRDSSKDPLLFCKRYKMHEEYLIRSEFKGNFREEIAKRLGISVQQSDRYNTMNKVILPVWEMVRDETVGMSSVLPMATHNEDEQAEILEIMKEFLESGTMLTRETMKLIIDGYRDGKRAYSDFSEIKEKRPEIVDSGLPLNSMIGVNEETGQSRDGSANINSDLHNEYDPIAAEADNPDVDFKQWEREFDQWGREQENQKDKLDEESDDDGEPGRKEKKSSLSGDEKEAKVGQDIVKYLEKLSACFNNTYSFDDDDEAESALRVMASTFAIVVDEMYNISREHGKTDIFKGELEEMERKLKSY